MKRPLYSPGLSCACMVEGDVVPQHGQSINNQGLSHPPTTAHTGSSLAPASQMRAIFQLSLQPLASSTKVDSKWRHVSGHLVKWQALR